MAVDPWQEYNCHTSHRIWICVVVVVVGMCVFFRYHSFQFVRIHLFVFQAANRNRTHLSTFSCDYNCAAFISVCGTQCSFRIHTVWHTNCTETVVGIVFMWWFQRFLFFISFRNSYYDRQNASTRHISMHILIKFQHEIEFVIDKHTGGYTRLASTTYHLTYVYFFYSFVYTYECAHPIYRNIKHLNTPYHTYELLCWLLAVDLLVSLFSVILQS